MVRNISALVFCRRKRWAETERFVASTTPALRGVGSLREKLHGEEQNATIRAVAQAVAFAQRKLSMMPIADASTREKSLHLQRLVFLNPQLMPAKDWIGLQGCHR